MVAFSHSGGDYAHFGIRPVCIPRVTNSIISEMENSEKLKDNQCLSPVKRLLSCVFVFRLKNLTYDHPDHVVLLSQS